MWAAHNGKQELAKALVRNGADVLNAMCAYVTWLFTGMYFDTALKKNHGPVVDEAWNIKMLHTTPAADRPPTKKHKLQNSQDKYTTFPMPSGNTVIIYTELDNYDNVYIQGHSFLIQVHNVSDGFCVYISNLRYRPTAQTSTSIAAPTAKAILDIAYSVMNMLYDQYSSVPVLTNFYVELEDASTAGNLVYSEDDTRYHYVKDSARGTELSWSMLTCVAYGVPYYTYLTQEMNLAQPLVPKVAEHPSYVNSWWINAIEDDPPDTNVNPWMLLEFRQVVQQWVQRLRKRKTVQPLSKVHGQMLIAVQDAYNDDVRPLGMEQMTTNNSREMQKKLYAAIAGTNTILSGYNAAGSYIYRPRTYEVLLKF